MRPESAIASLSVKGGSIAIVIALGGCGFALTSWKLASVDKVDLTYVVPTE